MRVGIALCITDQTPSVVDAAREIEERGFESLWLGEHSHVPADTTGKYVEAAPAADRVNRLGDPYVLLTAAATVTSRLVLGTAVGLPAEHRPLQLAKALATIDHLSGGRLAWGIGYGWNPLEVENNGVPFTDRRAILRENVRAIRTIWAEDTAEYRGAHTSFGPAWSWPKPVQRPHPPILFGAALGPRTIEDIVSLGSGWMPLYSGEEKLRADVATLRTAATDAGRAWSDLSLSLIHMDGANITDLDEFGDRLPGPAQLDAWSELGVDRVILVVDGPRVDMTFLRRALDAAARTSARAATTR